MNKAFILIISILILSAFTLNGETKWWQGAVGYEIFVRSFYDTDSNAKGDLNGVTAKLDYIESLGVDMIWLMPIFDSGSYHAYDVRDYYKIDDEYGTIEDFENLIKEADKRGIKVIMDLVINHTSNFHPWFAKSAAKEEPYSDWYVWEKEKPEGDWGGWYRHRGRDEYYYAVFYSGMPDLNLKSESLRQEIFKIAKFWIDKGVGGFRLDAARHIIEEGPGDLQNDTKSTIDWWSEFNEYVKSVNPDTVLIGEVWSSNSIISKYYNEGNGLDLCFDFRFNEEVRKAVIRNNTEFYKTFYQDKKENDSPLDFYAPFLSNHDTKRYFNTIKEELGFAKTAALFLLTSPGTPYVYYGEEIGIIQGEGNSDMFKRTPMQWNSSDTYGFTDYKRTWHPAYDASKQYTVEFQDKKKDSLLNFYRKMINIRKKHPAIKSQNYEFHDTDGQYIAFNKTSDDNSQNILIIANSSQKGVFADLSKFSGEYKELLSDKDVSIKGKKFLKKFEIMILQKK